MLILAKKRSLQLKAGALGPQFFHLVPSGALYFLVRRPGALNPFRIRTLIVNTYIVHLIIIYLSRAMKGSPK